jgi:hypothetical protein
MLKAATRLESFDSYKLWVKRLIFASNELRSVDIHRSDSLESLQLWAPRLEFLGLQACFALTRLVFRPWHELAHALVPRIFDRLYATLVNCVKLCERGRATALGQAGARLISLARTLPEPIVKKVLNKVVVHGKRLKWPGFEAPALELSKLNANLGPQAKTALRAHPRIVRSRTQHTGMSSEGMFARMHGGGGGSDDDDDFWGNRDENHDGEDPSETAVLGLLGAMFGAQTPLGGQPGSPMVPRPL